jgi:double-stranded uracil-DNA glycosylase
LASGSTAGCALRVLPDEPGWEDDLALAHGVGFTDIVKRPTARASEIRPKEFEYGRPLLEDKLDAARPRLLVFSFKRTAEVLFGKRGDVVGLEFGDQVRLAVFGMPGARPRQMRGGLQQPSRASV